MPTTLLSSMLDSITGVVPEDRSGIWFVVASEVLPTLSVDILEIRGGCNVVVVKAPHFVVVPMKRDIALNDSNFMILR